MIQNTAKHPIWACVFFNSSLKNRRSLRWCCVSPQQSITIKCSFGNWQQGFIKFLWNNSSRGSIFPTKDHELWRLYQDEYGNIEFGVSSVSDHAKKAFYSKSI